MMKSRDWSVLCFQPSVDGHWIKAHACSPLVTDNVLQDIFARYDDDLDYVIAAPDYGLDLPGMIHLKRPIEKFDLDGLTFNVPSECVVAIRNFVRKACQDDRDRDFVKVRNYYSCVCLTHKEAEMLCTQLNERCAAAIRRSDEFYASLPQS